MSNRAQAQYLRIYASGGSDKYLWQNYYVNSTVSWNAKSWDYFPFEFKGVIESAALGQARATMQLPATDLAVTAIEAAFYQQHICEINVYEFDTRLSQRVPQSGQTLISGFTGQVARMSGSFITLEVELGFALSPIGAQIPPRVFNSRLVGNPIKI